MGDDYGIRDGDESSDDVHRASYEPGDESVTYAVLNTVAAVSGRQITELEQLTEAINPDALEAIVRREPEHVTVSFEYEGFWVAVRGDGVIEVNASVPERDLDTTDQ